MSNIFRKPSTQEVSKFLASQGPFDFAVTVNLKKRHHIYQVNNSHELAEKSGYWLISRLNESVLKRKYRYKHEQLRTICSVERGLVEKRFHLHLALGTPAYISQCEFINKLIKLHKKMEWAHGDIYVTPYHSDGWINYISKEGLDSILL
jgi:hypothetical protein